MLWGARKPLISSEDMRDFHQMIVDNRREVIGRETIGLDKYLIIDISTRDRYFSFDPIGKFDSFSFGDLHTDHIFFAVVNFLQSLITSHVTVETSERNDESRFFCFLLMCCEFFLSREAIIGITLIKQRLNIFLVDRESLRLNVGTVFATRVNTFVRMQTEEIKGIEERITSTFDFTSFIGILDTDEELSMIFLREEIAVEGSSQTSDMELSGRRGGKTGAGHTNQISNKK